MLITADNGMRSLQDSHPQFSPPKNFMNVDRYGDHSNCEKGYKVYNISDNDHYQWRTSLKVDSNMTRRQ